MKKLLVISGILALLVTIYLVGPVPDPPRYRLEFPAIQLPLDSVDSFITSYENRYPLKKDNNALVVWAKDTPRQTPYVFLYLPGFTATRMEGDPVHRHVARHFGQNLYLARLAGHGLDTSLALAGFTAESVWESAQEALAIAENLGDKVIIISTSTGSPLALKLAAHYPDKVYALINLSPNLRIREPSARILNDPWGAQIARLVFGGDYRKVDHKQKEAELYWDTIQRVESLVQLEVLLETTLSDSLYQKITCPVLSLYYYRDEDHQDEVVDVSAIPGMHTSLGTPDSLKVYKPLPTPGDHVMGSSIKSKDYQVVEKEIIAYCERILHMKPAGKAVNYQQ